MKSLLLVCSFLLAFVARGFGYGHEGHQAIAEIARKHLSPQARAAVIAILGNDDLASVSTWLDDVRAAGRNRGDLRDDADAQDFVRRFRGSSNWHFVNIPVGSDRYEPDSPFASDNDVVHAIALAVETLEGKATGLSPIEALKTLVHCVGDIHQPLHCITGYYDLSNPALPRLLAPAEANRDSVADAGGNAVFFTKSQNLHELFDTLLLQRIGRGGDFRQLAGACDAEVVGSHQATAGDYHVWPVQWATESVRLGSGAYLDLEFSDAVTSPGKGRSVRLHRLTAKLPPGYQDREAPVLDREIGNGGLRLAELLNSIRWAPAR